MSIVKSGDRLPERENPLVEVIGDLQKVGEINVSPFVVDRRGIVGPEGSGNVIFQSEPVKIRGGVFRVSATHICNKPESITLSLTPSEGEQLLTLSGTEKITGSMRYDFRSGKLELSRNETGTAHRGEYGETPFTVLTGTASDEEVSPGVQELFFNIMGEIVPRLKYAPPTDARTQEDIRGYEETAKPIPDVFNEICEAALSAISKPPTPGDSPNKLKTQGKDRLPPPMKKT